MTYQTPRSRELPTVARRCRLAGIFGLAVLTLLVVTAGSGGCGRGRTATVIRFVNHHPVLKSDVEAVRAEARLEGGSGGYAEALETAIGRELVREEAERLGLTVGTRAVEARIGVLAASFGGRQQLDDALRTARMTTAQLQVVTHAILLAEAVQNRMFASLTASDADVRAFYRAHVADLFTQAPSVKLALIFVRTKGSAQAARARIIGGESFARVARQLSTDVESRLQGGMLGWVTASSLPELFARAIAQLGTGQLSEPVQGLGGWALFKLYARRTARVYSYSEVASHIRAELTRERRVAALTRWLKAERAKARVSTTS